MRPLTKIFNVPIPKQVATGNRKNVTSLFRSQNQNVIRLISTSKVVQFPISDTTAKLANEILEGKRSSLARAITLVESTLSEHQVQAGYMLSEVLQKQKEKNQRTFRIGISGSPGVGKSTFIEALGTYLVNQEKHKVAVLAVDPSSTRTGGSVLGDKTRMEELSRLPDAYVRPSPTRGTLGGVTKSTQDAIVLCEAAGYDIVLVETVGVGQSEVAVENMTDMFLYLVPPAGGDELQGIKKGIMELVDMVIINKADGDLIPIAKRAMGEYKTALNLMVPKSDLWTPPIKLCSAKEKTNISDIWKEIANYWRIFEETKALQGKRGQQRTDWMWKMIQDELMLKFEGSSAVQQLLPIVHKKVELGETTPSMAADQLLDAFLSNKKQ